MGQQIHQGSLSPLERYDKMGQGLAASFNAETKERGARFRGVSEVKFVPLV